MRTKLAMLFLLASLALSAQENLRGGYMPAVAVSLPTDGPKLAFKVESQQFQYQGSEANASKYVYRRTDLQSFIGFGLHPLWKMAVGFQYRFNTGELQDEQRTIQQVVFLQRIAAVRMAHRLRTDQTFGAGELSMRGRYRLSAEIPLNGQKVDPGEWYAVVSVESIFENAQNNWGLENRLVATLGYQATNQVKVEIGPDWRVSGFMSNTYSHDLWFGIGAYITLE